MREFEHGGDIYRNRVRLDFSVNTNPLGMSEKVKKAVIDNADVFGTYPDIECVELRKKIAEHEGVKIENILCSNGAAEMIFAVVRAVMPKKALIIAPTFSEYEHALKSVGCEIEYYVLKEENGFCVGNDIISRIHDVDMVFICNPNNPVGNIADKAVMESIAENFVDTVCVVDECFMDFAHGYSMKGKMPVIKAFTKTYSMAGLRLGYLIADNEIIAKIKQHIPAWNVSAVAQIAGMAALTDREYLKCTHDIINSEREYLSSELKKLEFKVFKSTANFILFKGESGLDDKLLKKGILIRSCDNFKGLGSNFYRIAIKTHDENKELIKELGDICG